MCQNASQSVLQGSEQSSNIGTIAVKTRLRDDGIFKTIRVSISHTQDNQQYLEDKHKTRGYNEVVDKPPKYQKTAIYNNGNARVKQSSETLN